MEAECQMPLHQKPLEKLKRRDSHVLLRRDIEPSGTDSQTPILNGACHYNCSTVNQISVTCESTV